MYYLELITWLLADNAQNLNLEKILTLLNLEDEVFWAASLPETHPIFCKFVPGFSEKHSGEKDIVLQHYKKISQFGSISVWEADLECPGTRKKIQRKVPYVWGVYLLLFSEKLIWALSHSYYPIKKISIHVLSGKPSKQLISSKGTFYTEYIPSLCWSSPSGWRPLFGPGVGLSKTSSEVTALGHCSARFRDSDRRSDDRSLRRLQEENRASTLNWSQTWHCMHKGVNRRALIAQREMDLQSSMTWRGKRVNMLEWQEWIVGIMHKRLW